VSSGIDMVGSADWLRGRSRWEARYAAAVIISDLGVAVLGLTGTRCGHGEYPLHIAPVDGLPLLRLTKRRLDGPVGVTKFSQSPIHGPSTPCVD
jgi:hypothetical protein